MDDELHADGADSESIGAPIDEAASPPPPVQRFRGTTVGTVLAAALTGLGDALEPSKKEDPAIVVEHDGGADPFSEPIVLRLDPDDPRDSIVMIRRHLMPRDDD